MIAPPNPDMTFDLSKAEVVTVDRLVNDLYNDLVVISDLVEVKVMLDL